MEGLESEDNGATKRAVRPVTFSEAEAEYLVENIIGRLATVSQDREPHVVPVAYRFDGSCIYFGGFNLGRSLKFRNIMRNNSVAFVVDDVLSADPWKPRGIEVRGYAEPFRNGANIGVKITPTRKASWGLQE
jgi:pyridoxamine 5'-phosphate oxidase family protein